ncbi:globin domain-containing protein [Streptomyces sp. NBC_01221]|uniref:globin domain-containing protein n=1 Tax=unclassified Streptomyces TaxID=2593676 RepID=UPI00224F1462|nr:globin domain-containing protein [Streptomyces sp. NBC_01221]MCX4784899.1 globin domain-containing protein [Streptomyces sp. NBC_01221]WSP53518.1 globin domain-containing protein [Streptomyces sp. NBC_01241]
MNTPSEDYHALLARHDAMRLRRRILTPSDSRPEPWSAKAPQAYDGTADQRLISDFLPLVSPLEELIAELYRLLFERHPYLRSLFPESMAFQQVHLVGIFRYLIGNLHRTDEMIGVFEQLGRDHRKLGVRPAHFEAFEAALIEALRVRAGARWTSALGDAWLRMLRLAVSAMVRGADEAIAEPPSWEATVTSHELRTPDLAVLRVRPHQPYAFEAGQYASMESPLLEQAWRPYYLARAPHPDGELEFHVRARGAGGVSDALVHGTREGGTVRLSAARGALALPDLIPSADILLIASGTGWAPMKALLQRIDADRSRAHRVRLLLGLAAPQDRAAVEEMYDAAYLEAFRRGRPWLTVIAADTADARFAGAGLRALNGTLTPRRGAAAPQHAFLALAPEVSTTGPAQALTARLVAAGVPVAHIHHETTGIDAVTETSASTTRTGLLSA